MSLHIKGKRVTKIERYCPYCKTNYTLGVSSGECPHDCWDGLAHNDPFGEATRQARKSLKLLLSIYAKR